MKRFSIHQGRHGYVFARADTLEECVDLVRYGDSRQMIGPIHPDAWDGVRIDERDRRAPYGLKRSLTYEEALAGVGERDNVTTAGPPNAPRWSAPSGLGSRSPNSDALWCGRLSQALRDVAGMIERGDGGHAAEYVGEMLTEYALYARSQGFDATVRV